MSSQWNKYLKYQINYTDIYREMRGYERVIIHIDVAGISKGFYSTTTIKSEVADYAASGQLPTTFLEEMKGYLQLLYGRFKQYNPVFVLFFDNGECLQNTGVDSSYKADRRAASSSQRFLVEEETMRVFKLLKSYYYEELYNNFNIGTSCYCIDLKEYESDLIPHLIRSMGLLGSSDPKTFNLMLALDKDLLQTCRYDNVRMAASIYYKAKKRLDMNLLNNIHGLSYIYNKFKPGLLTSAHLPIILSMFGDKADHIEGIKGCGPAKAIKWATQYFTDIYEFNKSTVFPSELQPYSEVLIRNFKLISFDEQIKRLPAPVISKIKTKLE